MNKIYWPVDKLIEWDKNARSTTDSHMMRLRNQIQLLGQYKPLLITNDNIVLGGNHRLRAYKDLGITEAWVSVIEFVQDESGLWYAILDGVKQSKGFTSKESGMMEYSLSDNDRVAKYDEDQLLKELESLEIDDAMYHVDLLESTSLIDLESQLKEETQPPQQTEPEETTEQPEPKSFKLTVIHEDQATLSALHEQLSAQGFKCNLS